MNKNFLLLSSLALMSISALAQEASKYTVRTLTFEDADAKGIVNYGGGSNKWSSLIDNPQYGGPMLYPASFDDEEDLLYGWHDENNTEIQSELLNNYVDGKFWGGGIAISNYIDDNLANGDYEHQLAVPVSNGSSNFAVVYCNSNPTIAEGNPQVYFEFADKGGHVIESLLISPTTYQLNACENGNGFNSPLVGEGDYLTVTFRGYLNGEATQTVSVDLARDGEFLTDWKEVSLLPLGNVTKVVLTMDSNDISYGYLNPPSYFAFDDVKVRFVSEGDPNALAPVSSEVVSVEYFSLSGQKLSSATDKFHIVKTTYSDGRVVTTKAIR